MDIQFLDIRSAYLTADMDIECFMEPPPGFDAPKGHIMRLDKALYGTKQGARLFHQKFRKDLIKWGFKASSADPCCFVKRKGESVIRVLLFVDDMAIMSDRDSDGKALKDDLLAKISAKYEFSTQPDDDVYLGMAVKKVNETSYLLTQARYVEHVMRKYDMEGQKAEHTPGCGEVLRSDCWVLDEERKWLDDHQTFEPNCVGQIEEVIKPGAPPRPVSNVKDNPYGRRFREMWHFTLDGAMHQA